MKVETTFSLLRSNTIPGFGTLFCVLELQHRVNDHLAHGSGFILRCDSGAKITVANPVGFKQRPEDVQSLPTHIREPEKTRKPMTTDELFQHLIALVREEADNRVGAWHAEKVAQGLAQPEARPELQLTVAVAEEVAKAVADAYALSKTGEAELDELKGKVETQAAKDLIDLTKNKIAMRKRVGGGNG